MCGIIGYSGAGKADADKLRLLLLMNRKRGSDAAGVYFLKDNPDKRDNHKYIYIHEKSGLAIDDSLIYLPELENVTRIFIGHCRSASYGIKAKENAHPFLCSDQNKIVLAHNGTLKEVYDLREYYNKDIVDKKYFSYDEINVDSKMFVKYFAKYGIDNLDILKRYDGAAALLYSDISNSFDVLNAFTDGERPLHYGMIGESMYISSEKEPLELIGCGDIKEFEKLRCYSIKDGKIISSETVITKDVYKKPPVVSNYPTKHNTVGNHMGYQRKLKYSVSDIKIARNVLNKWPDFAQLDYGPRSIYTIKTTPNLTYIIEYTNNLKEKYHTNSILYSEEKEVTFNFVKDINNNGELVKQVIYKNGNLRCFVVTNVEQIANEWRDYQSDDDEVDSYQEKIQEDLSDMKDEFEKILRKKNHKKNAQRKTFFLTIIKKIEEISDNLLDPSYDIKNNLYSLRTVIYGDVFDKAMHHQDKIDYINITRSIASTLELVDQITENA